MFLYRFAALILLFFLSPTWSAAAPAALTSANTPHTTVELISNVSTAKAGEPFWLGFQFKLQPGWHIYFENPGDSGLPPKVSWEGEVAQTIGPLLFPTPERIPLGTLVNYGYNNEVLFPIKAQLDSGANTDILQLNAHLTWLICHEDCVPEKADLSLSLPISTESSQLGPLAQLIKSGISALPKTLNQNNSLEIKETGDELELQLPDGIKAESNPYFFARKKGVVRSSAPQVVFTNAEGKHYLRLRKAASFKSLSEPISGVIQTNDGALHVSTTPHSATFEPANSSTSPTSTAEQPSTSYVFLLLFALLGGVILNLMPCVLPVLSLKVLSLCDHAHDSHGRQYLLAAMYALGIISSLLFLGGILLFFRAQGAQIGWGFQLQYPPVVALLAMFFFFVGLSFLGFFEVNTSLTNKAARLDNKEGLAGSFLSGLVATIVATPCTAPFMGTAVGVALFRPWYQALAIFASLGLGIALPYVALVVFPRLRKFLPRPGNWMITLKELLAFPLFATSIWLLWIVSVQRGGPGVILVLGAALISVLGIWLRKIAKRSVTSIFAAALIVLGFVVIPLPDFLAFQRGEIKLSEDRVSDSHGLVWEPYSGALIDKIVANHELAYLDFTAAWCITCQVNKAVVFSDQRVQDYIRTNNVKLIRADWTNQDAEITKVLTQYGRASVPFNLVFGKGANPQPLELPTILTPQTVLDFLAKAK